MEDSSKLRGQHRQSSGVGS